MAQKHEQQVTVSNRTVFRVVLLVVGTFLFLRFLHTVSDVLVLIFTAFFLALALNPAVSWIKRRLKSKSRVRATAAAYILVLSSLIIFIALVVPPLVKQSVDFINSVPDTLNNFKTQDSSVARFARKYQLDEQLEHISKDVRSHYGNITKPVLSTAGRVGSTLIATLTVIVLTFMMLVEGPRWANAMLELVPKERRAHTQKLIARMYKIVTGYVNGQVLIAAIAACFAMTALLIASTLFHVSLNAVALAGIVFLFGLIPLIGNTIAALIVMLICLFSSFGLALTMAIYFILYQQIENVTLAPYIQSKHNELTPLLVFAAALIGAAFGGIFGAFVAIPAAGCLKVLLEDYIDRKELREQ